MEVRRIKSDELYHHGIKGQKWGVRRFQNSDGTLTDEGKKKIQHYKNVKALNKKIRKFNNNFSKSVKKPVSAIYGGFSGAVIGTGLAKAMGGGAIKQVAATSISAVLGSLGGYGLAKLDKSINNKGHDLIDKYADRKINKIKNTQ